MRDNLSTEVRKTYAGQLTARPSDGMTGDIDGEWETGGDGVAEEDPQHSLEYDIDESANCFAVYSPKTKQTRRVPLFPEIRQALDDLRPITGDSEFVVRSLHRMNARQLAAQCRRDDRKSATELRGLEKALQTIAAQSKTPNDTLELWRRFARRREKRERIAQYRHDMKALAHAHDIMADPLLTPPTVEDVPTLLFDEQDYNT